MQLINPRTTSYLSRVVVSLVACFIFSISGALSWETSEYAGVNLGRRTIFEVTDARGLSAAERAANIRQRLRDLLVNPSKDPEHIDVRVGVDGVPVVVLDDMNICVVTDSDSRAFGADKIILAHEWAQKIQKELKQLKPLYQIHKPDSHQPQPLSEHAVLLLILDLGVLLAVSLVCGELFVRIGQPAIIGQIFSGILLGRTVMGNLFPDIFTMLFPVDSDQSKLIEVVSWIGVIFLLMLTGMETDTKVLKRFGKTTAMISFIGLAVPLGVGAVMSLFLPAELILDARNKLPLALFVGTVFAVSSVPVVAKVLMDMNLIRRDIGQLVLAASLAHDLLCCLLLALLAAVASSSGHGSEKLLTAPLGTLAFLLLAYYLGRPLVFKVLRLVNDKVTTQDGLLTAITIFLLFSAAITQWLGVHVILGAFVVGVALSQTPVVSEKVIHPLKAVTMGIFGPIFFAASGLNVDLTSLANPQTAIVTALLTFGAVASKLAGCYLGGEIGGLSRWESVCVGIGANGRGSMGLIVGMLGFSLGIITVNMFAIVIFISLVSTALVPPLLRWALEHVKQTDEEAERVRKEQRQAKTIMRSIRRVLWPTSGGGKATLAASFLNAIASGQVIETTLLTAVSSRGNGEPADGQLSPALDRKKIMLVRRSVRCPNPVEGIIDEASGGHDLIIFGTSSPTASSTRVFGELIDQVMLETKTPTLVIYDPRKSPGQEIKHVLIPVSGTELSMRAAEFGISLAKSLGAKITCLCVFEVHTSELYSEKTQSGEKLQENLSREVEESLSELSSAFDVQFKTIVRHTSGHVAQAILLTAEQIEADLIVVGASPMLGKALFLGHTVNFVLRHAPCAVAVLKL